MTYPPELLKRAWYHAYLAEKNGYSLNVDDWDDDDAVRYLRQCEAYEALDSEPREEVSI